MGTPPRPEAIRAVQEVLFVEGLQDLAQGVLDNLVLEGGDPQRTRLTLLFRDVDPSDRLMTPALRPQPLVQPPQVLRQVLPVAILRNPIHADRRPRAEAVV